MDVKITNNQLHIFIYATVNFFLPHFLCFFMFLLLLLLLLFVVRLDYTVNFLFHIYHIYFSCVFFPNNHPTISPSNLSLLQKSRVLFISHSYAHTTHRCATHIHDRQTDERASKHANERTSIRYLFVALLFLLTQHRGLLYLRQQNQQKKELVEYFIVSLGDKHAFIIYPMLPRLNGYKGVLCCVRVRVYEQVDKGSVKEEEKKAKMLCYFFYLVLTFIFQMNKEQRSKTKESMQIHTHTYNWNRLPINVIDLNNRNNWRV